MRIAFIVSFLANLGLLMVLIVVSPPSVAMHFGPGGEPGNWASPGTFALIMAGTLALIFVATWYSGTVNRIFTKELINIPNREYWLKEENRSRAEALLSREMCLFGTGVFLAFTAYWIVRLYQRFRIPEAEPWG